MYRSLLITALAVAAVSIPSAATGSSSAPNVTLTAVVGPAMNISLRNADGTNVSRLDPGTYDISVTDNSIEHNFHLRGPGVDRARASRQRARCRGPSRLRTGTTPSSARCTPLQMKGAFTVGNAPPPPSPPGKLSGKVTARTITLMNGGSRVRSVTENTYKVTISDSSNKQNFHLTGPGVNKKTGVAAKAKKTWSLNLKPGKYTYRSDKNRRLKRTFTVTAKTP